MLCATPSTISLRLSDTASESDERNVEKQPPPLDATPPQFSTAHVPNTVNDARHLLQSGASRRGNETGFNCGLTSDDRRRYTSADDGTWLIDDPVLEEVENDLQKIVNCTNEGDEIAFNVTGVIQPSSPVIIPWQLTLDTYVKESFGSDVLPHSKARTRFTCPRKNSGLFFVRTKSATFADLVIVNCTFDDTDEAQSVIEVSECHDRDSPGVVILRGVAFRKNGLVGASGLRMSEPSCSDLEMIDVQIADNVCSSDGCGVFLAKKSNLKNCTASGNRVVKSNNRMFSLLYAPASSNTTIQGLVAFRNNLAVLRVQDGDLSLSDASFSWNSLDSKHAGGMNYSSCIHVVKSSAAISDCSFTANEGYNGSAVLAEESNVSVSTSVFRENLVARSGGCVYALMSNVTLENTTANNSRAKSHGGFMYVEGSNVTLEKTTANNSLTTYEGGFMYVQDANATLETTTATNSFSEYQGGFMYVLRSNVMLENTTATDNSVERESGGFMFVGLSNMMLKNTTATNNRAKYEGGGFMHVKGSDVTLEDTKATNNSVLYCGGFMRAEFSDVTLKDTTATNSSAESYGGFMYVEGSNVTLEKTTATNSSAGYAGGSVDGMYSELRIKLSQFFASNSNVSGGFAALESSSIFMNDTEIVGGRSKNGGAIWMKKSNMTARNLSIIHCRADNSGGGVMSRAHSTLLCADCKFANNSAEEGNGGAIFFDSRYNQTLALQIVQSRFENNVAEFGGGLFFECNEKIKRCIANGKDCPFMSLTDTNFSGNKAKVSGGAIFAGYLEAIRFDCSNASSDTGSVFYFEDDDDIRSVFYGEKWKALKRLKSRADICPSWKGNHANVYGSEVGTYAYKATMTIGKDNISVCVSGGKDDCVVDGYRAGEDMPKAKVKLLDVFGQGPARNHRTVNANMSSADGEFMVGSIVQIMKEGTCTFESVRGFVAPGDYNLTVEFGEKAIKEIRITVIVRNCSIGETVAPDTGVCQECTKKTYNFNASAEECKTCPEHGNCDSRAITPDDGYWQKTPCSVRIRRCLPTSACKFEGRSEKLTDLVSNVTSCHFNETWIEEDYTKAQCAKGYEGPRCGSCSSKYGYGLSTKCERCPNGFVNVALILTSVLFLMGLTGITVNGTLNVRRTNPRELRRQNALTRSVELRSFRSLEDRSERANTDGPSHRRDSPNDQSHEGVPADDVLLAKWKAVEMFKIILSFIQTTVLLVCLDIGWSLPLFILAEAAEYMSGLASDGNRRSVMCLDLQNPFARRTALAFAFNICFVPILVFFLWMAFWTMKAMGYRNDRPPRYLAKRCMLSLMALWYVTLVPVLKTSLSIGLCVDADDSTTKYWIVDTQIKCLEDDHANLLYFVVLAFVCPMYGGLLIAFARFLRAPVEHLRDKNGWVYETTGFLYRSYSLGHRRYWEVAIVLRKVAISFMVFCAHLFDSVVPITGVAHVITLAIVAQIVAKPYRTEFKDLNKFELTSMFVSLVTTLVAITLRQEDCPEDVTRDLSTAACIVVNLATFVVFAYYNLKFLTEYLKRKLIEQNDECDPDWGVFTALVRFIGCEVKHAIDSAKERFMTTDASDDASTRC